ncbi:MAG: hypothetical protein ACTSPA_07455 [Promethearchaeota archaeon]
MEMNFSDLTLSQQVQNKIRTAFLKVARPLELAQYNYLFEKGSADAVLRELSAFQNHDGGIGHGIESDFHLPDSTPMATSVGLRILDTLPSSKLRDEMIAKALQYLRTAFYLDRVGWFSVTPEVNEFPHAPWWTYDKSTRMTPIDMSWGNPSAELFGYTYSYQKYMLNWPIDTYIEYALQYFERKSNFKSEHELYCFIHLYHHLSSDLRVRLEKNLQKGINALIVMDEEKWSSYVPQPLDFLIYPEDNLWGISEKNIRKNLQFYIISFEKETLIYPNWEWSSYPSHWSLAKKEWTGVLTLKYLRRLQKFGVIF